MAEIASSVPGISKTLQLLKSAKVDMRRDFKELPHMRLQLDLQISKELGHEKPAKLVEVARKMMDLCSMDAEPRLITQNGAEKALEISKMFGLPLNDNLKKYVRAHIANTMITELSFGYAGSDSVFANAAAYATEHGLETGELTKIEAEVANMCFQHGFYEAAIALAKRNELVELEHRASALKELFPSKKDDA